MTSTRDRIERPPGRLARRTALITGASSGIGLELTTLLARDGADVLLVARTRQPMDELAHNCREAFGVRAEVFPADLAEPAAAQRIARWLDDAGLSVDLLVNNAGFGIHGPFANSDPAQSTALLHVNIVALVQLTRLLLPGMIQRRWGRILNVASTAAFAPGPYMNLYYASKAFVLSHSTALGRELRGTGVSATCLCPGPTATDFQRRAGIDQARRFRRWMMDAPAVARAGLEGMLAGRDVVVPGLVNRMMALGTRLAPRRLLARITANLNRNRMT